MLVFPREAGIAGGMCISGFAVDDDLPALRLVGEFDGAGPLDSETTEGGERDVLVPEAAQCAVSRD